MVPRDHTIILTASRSPAHTEFLLSCKVKEDNLSRYVGRPNTSVFKHLEYQENDANMMRSFRPMFSVARTP